MPRCRKRNRHPYHGVVREHKIMTNRRDSVAIFGQAGVGAKFFLKSWKSTATTLFSVIAGNNHTLDIMNFQPTDYLSNLNLDFDANVSPEENPNDLDLFSQTEFFDLDVFSSDFSAPLKVQQSKQHQQQLQRQPTGHIDEAQPLVKQENLDHHLLGYLGDSVTSSPFVAEVATPAVDEPSMVKQMELGEIKRKRNTAASARFRIKKKLKEKQMEQQAHELQEKLNALEKKMKSLQMENKCLKQLILQKNEEKNCDLLESIKKRSLGDSGFTFTN